MAKQAEDRAIRYEADVFVTSHRILSNSQARGYSGMADKLDNPYHLVALMSYIFFRREDGSPRRLDSSFPKLRYGIVDNHETNFRTILIIDAVAHICVSEKKGQIFAVTIQLDPVKEEARLMIAENNEVASALILHLNKIWGMLQALSSEYAEERIPKSEVHQLSSAYHVELPLRPAESPEMPEEVGISLKIEIFRDIYLYSMAKQISRITKWWERLCQFMDRLHELRLEADLERFEQDVYYLVLALSLVDLVERHYNCPGNPTMDEEREEVYFHATMVNQYANRVLADRQGPACEILARKLQVDHSQEPFPLRRAIEGLTSRSRHIDAVFGFAHSPRLRPSLQYRILICRIQKQTRIMGLPSTLEEWNSILHAGRGEHDDSFRELSPVKLLKRIGSKEWVCPVHCECGLIPYLQTKQGSNWDNVPTFGYIGVSKLSSSSCRIWTETFNEQSGPQFYTRGSHGKWYWPWGARRVGELSVEADSLDKKMAEKVLNEYRRDKKHQAGWPFADKFWFSGDPAALPEHLPALPEHLTALASVAPRLDPAVASAPPGFGGRPEFRPDCRPTVWTMVWTGRLGSLNTADITQPRWRDVSAGSRKAAVRPQLEHGMFQPLATGIGLRLN
ncbi:hypothetical protein HOY82DRAFT_647090 [Tuber indicum]|nr:hypothetical protein HOY82DRAFT_647090 [Tuber indicum]